MNARVSKAVTAATPVSTMTTTLRKSTTETIDYALLNSLETGDVILFSGRARISAIIRWFTRSRWSHIGLVIKQDQKLYLLESTTLTQTNDVALGRPVKRAISLSHLEERVTSYCGNVAVRKLNRGQWTKQHQHAAMDFVRRWHLKPYKNYVIDYLYETLHVARLTRGKTLRGLFCSELIAEFYFQLGLVPRYRQSRQFVPGSFSQCTDDQAHLFRKLGTLHAEQMIKSTDNNVTKAAIRAPNNLDLHQQL